MISFPLRSRSSAASSVVEPTQEAETPTSNILTNYSVSFMQSKPSFISELAVPASVQVDNQSDKYVTYDRGHRDYFWREAASLPPSGLLIMLRRYLYGWYIWARAIYKVRTKRHGKGAMPWGNALRMAACARYLVDGQHRGGSGPRYMRRRG